MSIGPKRVVRPPIGTAAGDLLVATASGWDTISPTTDGFVLASQGPGLAPAFEVLPSLPTDAGLVSLASADAGAGLCYPNAANVWTRLVLAADKGIYATSASALATFDLTSFARALLDDTSAAAARTTLGLDTSGDYGDGSDGAVAFDGTNTYPSFATTSGSAPNLSYALTREVYATTLTISSGIKVRAAGFIVHSSGLTTNAGLLHNDGDPATGATGGAGSGAEGTLQASRAAGGNGGSVTGAGTANGGNGTGSGGRNVTGSASGAGGSAGAASGGAGGTASAATAIQGTIRSRSFNSRARLADNAAANGGNGGGGGGASSTTGTATGGGGGCAGGGFKACFYGYDGTGGVISANGGNGANGASTGDGVAGGGGGGCGGYVHVHVRHLTAWGTVQASGGLGGTGSNGGNAGGSGGAGVVVQLAGA